MFKFWKHIEPFYWLQLDEKHGEIVWWGLHFIIFSLLSKITWKACPGCVVVSGWTGWPQYVVNVCLITGGRIFFFLFAAALGPEKSFSRAARAALAFATFLLGPAPRNFCPSTSTWRNKKQTESEDMLNDYFHIALCSSNFLECWNPSFFMLRSLINC